MTIFQNKKTKGYYKLLGTVINTTNAQDGQIMFVYTSLNQPDDITEPRKTFVRERVEFLEKFELVEDFDVETNILNNYTM